MPLRKLEKFLDDHHVHFTCINHAPAYTAQEIAAKAHVSGKNLAKTVMIKVDDKLAMAVLPASFQINFGKLMESAGTDNVGLASEEEFKYLFPECQVGAMPPFGNLYGMNVFVANTLSEDEEIVFNAGTHTELIQMSYKDYENLVHPKISKFSFH